MSPRLTVALAAVVLSAATCSTDADPVPTDPGSGNGEVVEIPGVISDAGSLAVLPDSVVAPCDGQLCRWSLDGAFVSRYDGGAIVAVSEAGLWTDRVEDGVVQLVLLDATSGDEVRAADAYEVADVQDGPGQGLRDIAVSPDGARVAGVGADGLVHLWAADDLADESTIEVGGNAVAAAFSPDGSQIAVAASEAPVTIHDVASGEQVGELDAPAQGALEWAEAGWIASASFTLDDDAATTVWDGGTREVLATLDVAAYRLDVADATTLLLTEKNEQDVVRWQWEEDDVVRLTGATDVPRAVTHSPDGEVIAMSPRDGVLAWPADGGQPTTFEKPGG